MATPTEAFLATLHQSSLPSLPQDSRPALAQITVCPVSFNDTMTHRWITHDIILTRPRRSTFPRPYSASAKQAYTEILNLVGESLKRKEIFAHIFVAGSGTNFGRTHGTFSSGQLGLDDRNIWVHKQCTLHARCLRSEVVKRASTLGIALSVSTKDHGEVLKAKTLTQGGTVESYACRLVQSGLHIDLLPIHRNPLSVPSSIPTPIPAGGRASQMQGWNYPTTVPQGYYVPGRRAVRGSTKLSDLKVLRRSQRLVRRAEEERSGL